MTMNDGKPCIRPVENPNRQDIIEQLEWFLERAKNDEILGIAIVSVDRGDKSSDSYVSAGYRLLLIAELELVKRNILRTFE